MIIGDLNELTSPKDKITHKGGDSTHSTHYTYKDALDDNGLLTLVYWHLILGLTIELV